VLLLACLGTALVSAQLGEAVRGSKGADPVSSAVATHRKLHQLQAWTVRGRARTSVPDGPARMHRRARANIRW